MKFCPIYCSTSNKKNRLGDPEGAGNAQVLSQSIHLSFQELLAMAGLLKETPEQVRRTLAELTKGEQFNMALLFLYRLAFSSDNVTIRIISTVIGGQSAKMKKMWEVLLEAVGVR